MLEEVVDRVESTLKALTAQGGELLRKSELDVRLANAKKKTEQIVRDRPVESLVVGALVGYLIGRWMSRNR